MLLAYVFLISDNGISTAKSCNFTKVSFFLVYYNSVSSMNPLKDKLFYVVHKVQDLKLRLAGSDNSPKG